VSKKKGRRYVKGTKRKAGGGTGRQEKKTNKNSLRAVRKAKKRGGHRRKPGGRGRPGHSRVFVEGGGGPGERKRMEGGISLKN